MADETSTTQQISSGTFIAGDVLTSSTDTSHTNGWATGTIEDECRSTLVASQVVSGDVIQVRLTDGAGYGGGYVNNP